MPTRAFRPRSVRFLPVHGFRWKSRTAIHSSGGKPLLFELAWPTKVRNIKYAVWAWHDAAATDNADTFRLLPEVQTGCGVFVHM